MSDRQAKQLEALERTLRNPSEEPVKLSYPALETITEDFSVEIGRGGFGVVFLGYLPAGGKIAVKKLSSSQDLDDKLFMDEVNCLIRAKHDNIVRFLGYCVDTQGELIKFGAKFVLADVRQRFMCFEYVPNGNLYEYLKEKPSRDEWHTRYQMIRGICHGLNYLHEDSINHLDLKPQNVMLDNQMKPKITDFGLSRTFDEGQSRIFTRNICGTPGYIAPELIDNGEISFKTDIFSLGIIIIKLLTGDNKFDIENWQNLLDVDGPEAKICITIAQECLHADQHKRPTIGEIIHDLQNVISETRNHTSSLPHQLSSPEKTRSFGGSGGSVRDITEIPQRLHSVAIRAGGVIDSFEFSYFDQTLKKQTVGPWGDGGPSGATTTTIEMGPSEFVTEVSGTVGKIFGYSVITSLTIVTNRETYGPFGNPRFEGEGNNKPFSSGAVPKGKSIVGFFGRSGSFIDSIGFYIA